MKSPRRTAIGMIAILAAGCGGGGGGGSNEPAATVYRLDPPPALNTQVMYAQTTIDNSNNTISQTVRDTVTAVNGDGSYVYTRDDPNHNSPVINGTSYAIVTESITTDGAGHTQSFSYPSALVTCTFSPHGAGPDYPVKVGQTWSLNFVSTCGNAAPISYSETGSVSGIDSVAVPAGTFVAIRLESTITHTNANGTTYTESITTWRGVNTGGTVKTIDSIRYSGTVPTNGYPVTITTVLQSQL